MLHLNDKELFLFVDLKKPITCQMVNRNKFSLSLQIFQCPLDKRLDANLCLPQSF